jgi:hypothetical protein
VAGQCSKKLAAPGEYARVCINGVSPSIVWGIWIGTFFQKELNQVEIGHDARGACNVQRYADVWDRDSVDIGDVFDKLFC